MSSPISAPSSTAQTRRGSRWWVVLAFGVLIVLVAWFAEPVYGTVTFMVGRPYQRDCTTTVPRESTLGDVWYRISQQNCDNGVTRHYVFVARAKTMMSFMMTPAFMSIETPIPRSVSKEGRSYFIKVEPPFADGSDVLETFIGSSGVPLTVHIYDRGQKRQTR